MPASLRRLATSLLLACGFAATAAVCSAVPATPAAVQSSTRERLLPAAVFSPADEALLDDLERAGVRYFLEQSDPVSGLVADRAHADGSPSDPKASIAACGFGLTAWAIGAERGWIDRATAVERCRTLLRFLATKAPRVHGFFYHFMDRRTGARAWHCELSTIDTGLFLAGAILAREYFHDPEITALVNQLYGDIDWPWFLNNGQTFAMGWHVESGFSRFRWSAYSELMMLTLLGLGAQHNPIVPGVWAAWAREPVGDYAGYHYIQHPSLFVHQFTHAYVAFNGLRDAYADYYRNSVLATLAQRRFCADLHSEFPTWGTEMWGITASDSATGYKGGWGGPPRTMDDIALDGTLVPCAAAGSLPFTPAESMQALQTMRTVYGDRIWRRYGFVDAFNPETGWVDTDVVGIDVGIELLQAENARSNFVHDEFMRAPEVQRALARAGFLSFARDLPLADRDQIHALARQVWPLVAGAALAPQTAGLQLSALVAARALGFMPDDAALARATALLQGLPAPPRAPAELAQYAAGLVLFRQAFPTLAAEVSRRLGAIDWSHVVVPTATALGAFERLAVFFQIANGVHGANAWAALARVPVRTGPVYVLAPASLRDQFVPGEWLDERSIITGASAAQLTYADAIAAGAPTRPLIKDLLTLAALVDKFPAVAVAALQDAPVTPLIDSASLADRAVLLLSAANLLKPESIRMQFQQDPLVQAGRAAITEFAAAQFGPDNSVFWRRELAGPPKPAPVRPTLVAASAGTPRAQWPWVEMRGLQYKDSVADVRPGDPELAMRFAFTWDADALYFHADVTDGLPKVVPQPGERNGVELFINPKAGGFEWLGRNSDQFVFRVAGKVAETFHQLPVTGHLSPIAGGYTVEARIPWSDLGLTPHAGLELGASPAVVSEGRHEWEPALKLNWQYFHRTDGRIQLGLLRLE